MRASRKFVLKGTDKKLPLGTTWTITESGTFTVAQTGYYNLEIHGGGGGGGDGAYIDPIPPYVMQQFLGGGGGGGSGELFTSVLLRKGTVITVTIGEGGVAGTQGGTTTFGEYSVAGGGKGGNCTPAAMGGTGGTGGTASGSLATAGSNGGDNSTTPKGYGGSGGYGNSSNTTQTYGNGGKGGTYSESAESGKPGAVILTLVSYN